MKFLLLICKNIGRNPIRSTLTALGTMVLVFVITLVWAVLAFLDAAMAEKSQNLKAIVSEKWQIPSQMPYAYAPSLTQGAARNPGDLKPTDSMTWTFYGGTLDIANRTRENSLFAFALEPSKLLTMMDELDSLPPSQKAEFEPVVYKLQQNKQGLILGKDVLKNIKKKVGNRIKLSGLNYRDIDLEFDIVGQFPEGRYNPSAAMNRDYLLDALDVYPRTHGNKPHAMAGKALNLVWIKVNNRDDFNTIAGQITNSPEFSNPAVKCETAASGVTTFLEAYKDILWGMRWLLGPAILISLSLVIANAISISVRERRIELAVLKVLGYRPRQILLLVLGEAVLIGSLAGFLSAAFTYGYINHYLGGLKLPIAFFSAFYIPTRALWWGLAVGAGTAFVGSVLPALSAQRIKVSEVFSKVA